jgi:hypothetical protein
MKIKRFKSWIKKDVKDGRKNHLAWDTDHIDYQPMMREDASIPVHDIHNPVRHNGDMGNDKRGRGSQLTHEDHRSMSEHALSFSPEHQQTISGEYKTFSSRINRPLRTGEYDGDHNVDPEIIPMDKHEHSDHVEKLDHITSHVMPRDHVTFRGATSRYDFHKLNPGDHFIDYGYTGTSHDPDTAHDFSSKMTTPTGDIKHKLFRIHMPAGTKAYHLDRHENDHDHEQETLLHRGTKFRVGDHHSYDNHHVVDLHVVSQGHSQMYGKEK